MFSNPVLPLSTHPYHGQRVMEVTEGIVAVAGMVVLLMTEVEP